MVPQAGTLNRGIWEGIESAVRDLAVGEGQLYVITGIVFKGRQIQSIGASNVLVPTETWKAVYDPTARAASADICSNTDHPQCSTGSITQLAQLAGIAPLSRSPGCCEAGWDAAPTTGSKPLRRFVATLKPPHTARPPRSNHWPIRNQLKMPIGDKDKELE